MAVADKSVRTFQELATRYDQIGEPQVRDRFLVLAAEAALTAGRTDEAEAIRGRLLQLNPHHLLKPYASINQAMQSPDVKSYVEGLRRTYPREQAEQMLESIRAGGPEKSEAPAPASPTFPPFKAADSGKTEPFPARVKEAPAKPAPAKVDTPVEKPAPPSPPAPPIPPAPQAALEAPIPFAADFVPSAPTPTPSAARDAPRPKTETNLLVTALFLMVLLIALALAIYTLVKPFV